MSQFVLAQMPTALHLAAATLAAATLAAATLAATLAAAAAAAAGEYNKQQDGWAARADSLNRRF